MELATVSPTYTLDQGWPKYPAAMEFSEDVAAKPGGDLELKIEQVGAHPEPDGNLRVMVTTSRGEIRAILHPCPNQPVAAS